MKKLMAVLYVFVPAAFVLKFGYKNDTWLFVTAALGIIPLAGMMGHATEGLAVRTGPAVGAFLNAALGNAAELIIALVALFNGKYEIVQASITGSIIGNILFILGLSFFLGGWKRESQSFSRIAAESGVAMLYVCVSALSIPSILVMISHFSPKGDIPGDKVHAISVATSVILLIVYALSLLFAFKTHKHVFVMDEEEEEHAKHTPMWKIVTQLLVSAGLIAFLAEFLTGSVEHAAEKLGLAQVFVGVIIVAIVGNAAEHTAAIMFAMKDKMNLAMNIAIESSKQIALFVAPILILIGAVTGHPMSLDFTPMEAAALGISVIILALLVLDGKSNWLEGVMLLAVYAVLAVAFYYTKDMTAAPHGAGPPGH
jgi:Ca2+:H+ antiporter